MNKFFIALCLLFVSTFQLFAQSTRFPNIDFELGNLSVWKYSTGTCCPISLTAVSAPVTTRHTLTSDSTILDPYGLFPIVSPLHGRHSLKLGNDSAGSLAEGVRYVVHVPSGTTPYNLIFCYAIVLEDGGHDSADQPRFLATVKDSVTEAEIPCLSFSYVASANLPGFKNVTAFNGKIVVVRPWYLGTMNLSKLSGKTLFIDFATGDCAQGAHFGYAYVDVMDTLYEILNSCGNVDSVLLSGPPGYEQYLWYNSDFSDLLGSGNPFSLQMSISATSINLIALPYEGYGCKDTLSTVLKPNDLLLIDHRKDITFCELHPYVEKITLPDNDENYSFIWTPSNAVSCAMCQTTYILDSGKIKVTVFDKNGCAISDSFHASIINCNLSFPNAFTPNDDGKNDFARAIGVDLKNLIFYNLSIFNRFGERVFTTEDYNEGWDGKHHGVPQDANVFYYEILYQFAFDQKRIMKGDLTLIR